MSDHASILENLAAYLSGGLEPAERERLEQHTTECSSCAAALNDARSLDTTLSGLFVEVRPSAVLEDRVIQALRNRRPTAWRLPVPAWLAFAAAAMVLIGFTGAMASQILLPGDLLLSEAPNGSMGTFVAHFQGWSDETHKSAGELSAYSRGSMVSDLEQKEQRIHHANDPRSVLFRDAMRADNNRSFEELYGSKGKPKEPAKEITRNGVPMVTDSASLGASEAPHDARTGIGSGGGTGMGVGMVDGSVKSMRDMGGGRLGYRGIVATDDVVLGTSNGFQPGKMLEPLKKDQDEKGIRDIELKSREAGKRSEAKFAPSPKDAKPSEENESGKPGIQQPEKKPQPQPGPRKIVIRTGEIEYEVQSFDAAVATITRLVKDIKSGFIATVNSDKLANGKVRGSIVVRVPPENLDQLILELRTNLGKSGELKNQRIASQDITKQYTDLESELKAARAMEERLLQIIKTGKGEIKDLLAAEKELGNWRTRIEKIEGELRYYAHQVALSTLTITLYEKEIAAPFAVIERENVQMGIEVEDVDQALQAAQKAVREAKGRITRSELKQPSQGQFSAMLHFEVSPDAAGPLRDRLKQLGTVARFDITRLEENQGGAGKPSDGKTKRSDTRFQIHFYNLTDVPPRETVFVNLACIDVETAMKALLARVEKAAGRVVSSSLASSRGAQAQGDLQFQVKTPLADAVLADIKSAGEVMGLQVRETTNVETTRKKRGFQVRLWALEAAAARETDEIQLACTDVAASYRGVQEAVLRVKGRVRNAQLDEQDRRQVTGTLDFEVRRADEDGVRAALLKAGAVYTRKVSRAADAENVVDSKVHWRVTFINQSNIPPRETYVFGVEVADVDKTAAMLSALAGQHGVRTVKSDISRERSGRVTGALIYDVPVAQVHELLDAVKSAGLVRVQQSVKHAEVADSPLAVVRLDVTLSNEELIVRSDDGFKPNIRRGLSNSIEALSWSLRLLILGLCVLLPWALVLWGIYRLVVRLRRRTASSAPAA
jgi:hypothetical protein